MRDKIAHKLAYVGGGTGLALFAIFGLLPGSFLGGVLGLNIATALFGTPVDPSLVPRIIIAVGMLIGVMIAALVFVLGAATLGWAIGTVVDVMAKPRKAFVREEDEEKSLRA